MWVPVEMAVQAPEHDIWVFGVGGGVCLSCEITPPSLPHLIPGKGQERARIRISQDGGACHQPMGAPSAALCARETCKISDMWTGPWKQVDLSGVLI